MGFKESLARFFHLDKQKPLLPSQMVLNQFFLNPEAMPYDIANNPVKPVPIDQYNRLKTDITQRKRWIQLNLMEDHMDIGVPLIDHSYVTNSAEKELFTGLVNIYGVTFHPGSYKTNEENIEPTLYIEYYGFDRKYSYDEYVELLQMPMQDFT